MVLQHRRIHVRSLTERHHYYHDHRGHYHRRFPCLSWLVPCLLLLTVQIVLYLGWYSIHSARRQEVLRTKDDGSPKLLLSFSNNKAIRWTKNQKPIVSLKTTATKTILSNETVETSIATRTIASNTRATRATNETATSMIASNTTGISAIASNMINTRSADLTSDNDGTFNGVPLTLYRQGETRTMYSTVHCAGDNYIRNETHDETWKHRSCEYQFFCFDTETKEFQIFPSERQQKIQEKLRQNKYLRNANDNFDASVSIGAINLASREEIPLMEWRPKIMEEKALESFFMLPDDVVLVPFHSLNAANPGHLIWDDQLPIYTLLHMFNALPNQETTTTLLPIRYVLPTTAILPIRYILPAWVNIFGEKRAGLWASCDYNENKTIACQKLMKKFWPLMLGTDSPYKLTSTNNFEFEPRAKTGTPTTLVCAKRGMAGIGSLSDHGTAKSHGWVPEDYEMTHNHGRGGLLYDFRNFAVGNLGISVNAPIKPKIVISQLSMKRTLTDTLDLIPQLDAIKQRFSNVQVEGVVLERMPVEEQIRLVSDAAVYITHCGGGAVTGMFLPKGAAAILYYPEKGGWKHNKYTGKPAMLDWDLWTSLSYLHVHWMPRSTMDTPSDLEHLLLLIEQQLSLVNESYAAV